MSWWKDTLIRVRETRWLLNLGVPWAMTMSRPVRYTTGVCSKHIRRANKLDTTHNWKEDSALRQSAHETPQQHGSTTACPKHSSFLDRSLILFNCCSHDTLLHIGLPNCITSVPTMYQNTFLWLNYHKGQQHKKEHEESRVHQHDSVTPTVRSDQGQIRKSEHIPWDENVVSSHHIDHVQLTDCVTDEFRFQHFPKILYFVNGFTSLLFLLFLFFDAVFPFFLSFFLFRFYVLTFFSIFSFEEHFLLKFNLVVDSARCTYTRSCFQCLSPDIKCSICSYHQTLTRTPHERLKKTIHGIWHIVVVFHHGSVVIGGAGERRVLAIIARFHLWCGVVWWTVVAWPLLLVELVCGNNLEEQLSKVSREILIDMECRWRWSKLSHSHNKNSSAYAARTTNNLATAQVRQDTPSLIDVKGLGRPKEFSGREEDCQ